jgi:hypothetical protein
MEEAVSGHADYATTQQAHDLLAQVNRLLAENQRLREALERIADVPEWWQGEVAREALAGDAE